MATKKKEAESFQETVNRISRIDPSERDDKQRFEYHAAVFDMEERVFVSCCKFKTQVVVVNTKSLTFCETSPLKFY